MASDSFKKRSGCSHFHGCSQVYSKENTLNEKNKAELICSGMGYHQNKKESKNKSKEETMEKN